MVARDCYRSQIQRCPRARLALPKKNTIQDNRQRRIKIQKLLLEFKNVEVKRNGCVVRKMTAGINLSFQHLNGDVNINLVFLISYLSVIFF